MNTLTRPWLPFLSWCEGHLSSPPEGVEFVDTRAAITAGAGCVQLDPRSARCTAPTVPAEKDQVVVLLADGKDLLDNYSMLTTRVEGGDGDDTMRSYGIGVDRFYGGPGIDTLNGGKGADLLDGGAGDDVLSGGNWHDTLLDGPGDDTVRGGSGDDVLISGFGADDLDGGGGTDSVEFGNDAKVTVRLDELANDGSEGEKDYVRDTIEVIYGTKFGDVLVGDDDANVLRGMAGWDVIYGEGGDDVIHGGVERDIIWSGDGGDTVYGEGGNDVLYGTYGDDHLDAGPSDGGADDYQEIWAGHGEDTCLGDDLKVANSCEH